LGIKQTALEGFFKPVIGRNTRFRDVHKGETCYIFGNGASLKSMDISVFSNQLSIGLNFIGLHNDLDLLQMPYYVIPAPKFLYPFYRNPYTHKIQLNPTSRAFARSIKRFPDINLFTSISNIFGYRSSGHNFYMHDFGCKSPDIKHYDLAGRFSFMKGGFYAGLGLALYMGFSKAVLVGCDYFFTPIQNRHFYAKGKPARSEETENIYGGLVEQIKDSIDLKLITDDSRSDHLPYETYEEFSGRKLCYRENTELVSREYLDYFDKAHQMGLFQNAIY